MFKSFALNKHNPTPGVKVERKLREKLVVNMKTTAGRIYEK